MTYSLLGRRAARRGTTPAPLHRGGKHRQSRWTLRNARPGPKSEQALFRADQASVEPRAREQRREQ
jgi:hypothetical protein